MCNRSCKIKHTATYTSQITGIYKLQNFLKVFTTASANPNSNFRGKTLSNVNTFAQISFIIIIKSLYRLNLFSNYNYIHI